VTDAELVEAWVHAHAHDPLLGPFTDHACGIRSGDVRLIVDHDGDYVVSVMIDADSVWVIDRYGDRAPMIVRWQDGRGVEIDAAVLEALRES
jgi:hypothetical protein